MSDLTSPATIPADVNGYITLPVTVDATTLAQNAYAFIAAQIPGWVPPDGDLLAFAIQAMAMMVSARATIDAQVSTAIFQYFGGALLGVQPNLAASAETTTTWQMVDDQGYTVPAGTQIGFQTSGSTTVIFSTTADFTVPAGQTTTAAGAVTVQAQVAGSTANNIPDTTPITVVSSLAYVESVVATAVTSGGADAETTGAYLNRLSNQLQLLSPRPVLAADFALLAMNEPFVARALAIDNFNPNNNTLTAVDASFETGVGTWTAGTNTTVAQSTTWAADGTHSLSLTATASGAVSAQSGWYPVSAGSSWSGMFQAHAGSTGVAVTASLVWADINFNVLSTTNGTPVTDSTSGGVQCTVSGTGPSNCAYVRLKTSLTATASGQVHYVDECGLFSGLSVTTWSAGGQQTGQERCVTIVPVDIDGNALTGSDMTTLSNYLEGLRETNFLVNVVPPTYTAIAVVATLVCDPGTSLDSVQAVAETALEYYLSPANWGQDISPPNAVTQSQVTATQPSGGATPLQWLNDTTVYYLSVAAVLNAVPGVHHISALTLNGGTSDVNLAGYAPLPDASVSISVTAAPAGS